MSSLKQTARRPARLARRLAFLVASGFALVAAGRAVSPSPAPLPPLEALRSLAAAYAARDADAAAALYAPDARMDSFYDGVPPDRLVGRDAIRAEFARFLASVGDGPPPRINFRVTVIGPGRASGFYRISLGPDKAVFGRFDVAADGTGRLVSDTSRSATRTDFEEAAGPVLLAADDEELDRRYYAGLAGRYRLADGCDLVVTRAIARLHVRNRCDGSWRGLNRLAGRSWSAGDRVISDKALSTYDFAPMVGGSSPRLTVRTGSGPARVAVRRDPYRVRDVQFTSPDGTVLAGTLYEPTGAGRHPGAAMVHGSGPQDRDGYASIIAVLADELAANGRAVLAYDKRGSGTSGGNGAGAGFDVLAADAEAARRFLADQPGVNPRAVGFAGSSQAGWVVASAIAAGAEPADVFLLGAAGTAFSVREQNLYNTDVMMRCAGIAADARAVALRQQAAFFDALADRARAGDLDRITRAAAADPRLKDWLFPDSTGLDERDAWYTVLPLSFDPRPVWRGYRGRRVFLFGEVDDSTDTRRALPRVRRDGAQPVLLAGAQHLGLRTGSACRADLAQVDRFTPALFAGLARFARRR